MQLHMLYGSLECNPHAATKLQAYSLQHTAETSRHCPADNIRIMLLSQESSQGVASCARDVQLCAVHSSCKYCRSTGSSLQAEHLTSVPTACSTQQNATSSPYCIWVKLTRLPQHLDSDCSLTEEQLLQATTSSLPQIAHLVRCCSRQTWNLQLYHQLRSAAVSLLFELLCQLLTVL